MNSIYGNIDDLFLFCAVVDKGSLLSASRSLELPVSTMSRRLSALEDRLGIRLLEKKGRELVATRDGEVAFQSLSSGMESLEASFLDLVKGKDVIQGKIKLTVPHNFYGSFLSSTIENFLIQYPKVQLDLILSQQQLVPETDRDLLVTFNVSNLDGMIARPLFKAKHGFFTSDKYLKRKGDITTPQQLAQQDWVSVDHVTDIPLYKGRQFEQTISVQPKFVVNDIHRVAEAVEHGLGVASLPFRHISSNMKLIQLLPEYHRGDRQAYLVYKERKYQPKALTLLIDALIESIRSFHNEAPVI